MEQIFTQADLVLQTWYDLVQPMVNTPINGRYSYITSQVLDDSLGLTAEVIPFISDTAVGWNLEASFSYGGNTYTKSMKQGDLIQNCDWKLYMPYPS